MLLIFYNTPVQDDFLRSGHHLLYPRQKHIITCHGKERLLSWCFHHRPKRNRSRNLIRHRTAVDLIRYDGGILNSGRCRGGFLFGNSTQKSEEKKPHWFVQKHLTVLHTEALMWERLWFLSKRVREDCEFLHPLLFLFLGVGAGHKSAVVGSS